jgi:preprotein translocase subunit SecA
MARFMAERSGAGGQRYDREGLYRWGRERFPNLSLTEEEVRTLSRARIQEQLKQASQAAYPTVTQDDIDTKLDECFRGTKLSDADDAKEMAEWATRDLKLNVPEAELKGITQDQARQILWNAFDEKYRPEMRGMERSLLLNQLDSAWKNHLYTMDHLRSVVGLRSYGQEDPKTVYKREGMKEFDSMWEGVQDKVTEVVFRMEEAEGFQESLWTIGATIHETAPRALPQAADQQVGNTGQGEKKIEPIRNKGERVGRNDPCPCGSGKKYKNCHMKLEAGAR